MIYYHSKFTVTEMLKNLQSSTAICKNISSPFGTPKELITYNGPEFTSHYFKLFPGTWDFDQTISPQFHQSDGFLECAIQTVKCTLKKAKLANEDHYLLKLFLNFQSDKCALSPAHKLFNRPICTNLPFDKP